MEPAKRRLLESIDRDGDLLIGFLQEFIGWRTPNPSGDRRSAARHVRTLLDTHGVTYQVIAPNETMPNIVANFAAGKPGRHLALNGHIDVFPVGSGERWTRDPWGGELVDGQIYGRGACDMKAGTTASLFTFLYLREMREYLRGELSVSVVSDEETFGPWGARYLFEHHPEIIGDCCLNAEPSSPLTLRFGEKGKLWLKFRVRTLGAHGAYTHMSRSATGIAAEVISELAHLSDLPVPRVSNIATTLDQAAEFIAQAYGRGASTILQGVTVNPGLIRGGLKVNMVAAECDFEVDIRLPVGVTAPAILAAVDRIVAGRPEVSYAE